MGQVQDVPSYLRSYADRMAAGDETTPERILLIVYDKDDNPEVRSAGFGDQGFRETVGTLNEGVRTLSAAIASINSKTGN